MIGYRYDDGGHTAAGFNGNAADCVIRAIAILTRAPYTDIHRRMAAAMKHTSYSASGDAYRQKPRPGIKPRISARAIQNLVKTSYGLRRVTLGKGTRPTYTEAWLRHRDCLVGTAQHISAIVDGNLRDTFDCRVYDGRRYGGTAADQRKAQSFWLLAELEASTVTIPSFDPLRLIPPPRD